jgi:hypothetical protein
MITIIPAYWQRLRHLVITEWADNHRTGAWSATIKCENFGPIDIKGYWSVIREGDDWKIRMLTTNVTPAPCEVDSIKTRVRPFSQVRFALASDACRRGSAPG